MDSESSQVGVAPLKSNGCTRAIGVEKGEGPNLDLRNKEVNISGSGCETTVNSKPFEKTAKRKRATFTFEPETSGR